MPGIERCANGQYAPPNKHDLASQVFFFHIYRIQGFAWPFFVCIQRFLTIAAQRDDQNN